MTNVFVGFQNDQKNCRRSLKPPGGGTSDFFNFALSEVDSNTSKKMSTLGQEKKEDINIDVELKEKLILDEENEKNSIGEQNCEITKVNEPSTEIVQTQEELKNHSTTMEMKTEMAVNTTTISNTHNEVIKEVISEKKSCDRVPPGGYSKGLW
ncbi:hypothetical protein JTB14_036472 [Gonioctena quinquepunctata]|nr:hypothetical protein JTB14_036472 [Gonioctena quinquepunctata]